MQPIPRRPFFAHGRMTLALMFGVAAGACAAAPAPAPDAPNPREGQIISRADIARSGAKDAWEALRRGASHVTIRDARGNGGRAAHRGSGSLTLSSDMLLIVDGTPMNGLGVLRDIRAGHVEYIQVLPARVGVVKYGTSAGNGVIVVRTGVPPASR